MYSSLIFSEESARSCIDLVFWRARFLLCLLLHPKQGLHRCWWRECLRIYFPASQQLTLSNRMKEKKGIQKINHRRIEKIVQLKAFVIYVSCSSLLFSSLSSSILAWIMWIIISVFKAFAKIWECIYKITTGLLGLVLRILYEINIYPYWCYCFHLSFIIFTIIWNKIPEGRMLKLHYFW